MVNAINHRTMLIMGLEPIHLSAVVFETTLSASSSISANNITEIQRAIFLYSTVTDYLFLLCWMPLTRFELVRRFRQRILMVQNVGTAPTKSFNSASAVSANSTIAAKWTSRDSNPEPTAYKAGTLTDWARSPYYVCNLNECNHTWSVMTAYTLLLRYSPQGCEIFLIPNRLMIITISWKVFRRLNEPSGVRTPDPLLKREMLCQLS